MGFIEKVIEEIEKALESKLYNIGLISILTLPDIICQSISDTDTNSKTYINWFDEYVSKFFSKDVLNNTLLNGNDCYSLRCSVLHKGTTDITVQRKRKNLENFIVFASHNPKLFIFKEFEDEKYLRIDISVLFKNIVYGYMDWKRQLSPDLLKKFNLYNSIDISEINVETIDILNKVGEEIQERSKVKFN